MTNDTPTTPLFTNRAYDILKWLVQIVMPAAGTLYFTLAQIWGFQYAEQVVGTIAALTLFVGVVMKLSNRSYEASDDKYDGALQVTQVPGDGTEHSLVFNAPLDELQNKKNLLLKVTPQ